MQIQMTERDKKLIVFLSVFVIVVAIGYWGIYPAIKKTALANMEIQEQKDLQQINEMKMAQVTMLEVENERLEEEITEARAEYFPLMTNDEIDKLMTTYVLGYNVYAYDLAIHRSDEQAEVGPYKYSEKAQQPVEIIEEPEPQDVDMGTKTKNAISDVDEYASEDGLSDDLFASDELTGIYAANLTLKVGGDAEQLQKIIDDLSHSGNKLQLVGYTWSNVRSIEYDENGSYDVILERILTLSIDMYMCAEEE